MANIVQKRSSRVIILILLVVALIPISIDVQAASTQSQSAQLQTLVQVATSSRNYATTIVDSAKSQGLNITSFATLLASGNTSLAIAMSDLSNNSNLTGGIELVQIAATDFTSAAEGASLLLLNTKTDYSFEAMAGLDSISEANSTATQLTTTVSVACSTNLTNSSYDSQFQSYCTSGRSYLSIATADFNEAHLLLSTKTTIGSATINQSQGLIADARGNLSLAANVLSELSQFTYSQRVQQYLSGPFAQTLSIANSTVTTQRNLVSSFNSDLVEFQTFKSQQSIAVTNVESGASSLATSIGTTLTATTALSSQVTAEEADLSTTTADISGLSALASTLPQNLVGNLVTDIANVQSAISASNSALLALNSQASSFNKLSLSSLGTFSTNFQSASSLALSDNQALLSSLQTLETGVSALATTLLQLAPYESTVSSLTQTLSSDGSTISTSTQLVKSDISSSQSALISFQSTLQSSSQIQVSTTLSNNITSIYSSEATFLNATALAQLQTASASIQTTSQTAGSYVALATSLASTSVLSLNSSVQSLSSSGSSLLLQTSSTLSAMSNASTLLSADLQIRSQAFASANSDIIKAVAMFDDLQISQGASLLAQASVQLQIASQAS